MENRAKARHTGRLEVCGLPAGDYAIILNGKARGLRVADSTEGRIVEFPVSEAPTTKVAIARTFGGVD